MNGAGWACPTCAARCDAAARHCSACGEQRLPLPGWRFSLARWRLTLRCLVLQPGRLTADHAQGRRQPYVPPLSLFLAINVVFFVAQSLSGLSVLSIGLNSHLQGQRYSALASDMVAQRLARRPLDRERFEDRFALQQQTLAKATAIVMAPLLALASWACFRRRGGATGRTHLVFALHFYAFVLLFLTVFFGLLAPLLGLLQHWGHVPAHADLDNFATAIEAVVIGSYFYLAAGRVFGAGRLWRLLAAVVLVFAVLWTLYLHRFAIFLATVWMV